MVRGIAETKKVVPMNNDTKPKLFSPGVGKRGMTQLHYDAYCDNLEGLLWCLEKGFEVNVTDTCLPAFIAS